MAKWVAYRAKSKNDSQGNVEGTFEDKVEAPSWCNEEWEGIWREAVGVCERTQPRLAKAFQDALS
jgi:hypothetical protein